eukprot:gene15320-21404_t
MLEAGGHETVKGERQAQIDWLLQTAKSFYVEFEKRFLALWEAHSGNGDLYCAAIMGPDVAGGPSAQKHSQQCYMKRMFGDIVGFSVGIAHVADMDKIPDLDTRAACELRCLRFGRRQLVESLSFTDIETLVNAAAEAAKPN